MGKLRNMRMPYKTFLDLLREPFEDYTYKSILMDVLSENNAYNEAIRIEYNLYHKENIQCNLTIREGDWREHAR